MTDTEAARVTLSAAQTTARSSVCTTMRRMTAVRGQTLEVQEGHGQIQVQEALHHQVHGQAGPSGAASARAVPAVASGKRRGLGCVSAPSAAHSSILRRRKRGLVWASSVEEWEDGLSSIIILENKTIFREAFKKNPKIF